MTPPIQRGLQHFVTRAHVLDHEPSVDCESIARPCPMPDQTLFLYFVMTSAVSDDDIPTWTITARTCGFSEIPKVIHQSWDQSLDYRDTAFRRGAATFRPPVLEWQPPLVEQLRAQKVRVSPSDMAAMTAMLGITI